MLTISTWLWGDKYGIDDVLKLRRGVKRWLGEPHRFIVMTERDREWTPPPDIERYPIVDEEYTRMRGCFARLRMFDYEWQREKQIDDRLVCIDLDSVVLSWLDVPFKRLETFVILGGANSINPCPFNGSLMMLRPGHHGEVWTDFSLEAVEALRRGARVMEDQNWLFHKLPKAATWPSGPSGIVAYKKPGWPPCSDDPPGNARLVVFPGPTGPCDYPHLGWVSRNWV